jgi:hypothetical protein
MLLLHAPRSPEKIVDDFTKEIKANVINSTAIILTSLFRLNPEGEVQFAK